MTSPSIDIIKDAYDLPKMSKYLDFIFVKAYDYHTVHSQTAEVNAPLYETRNQDYFSIAKTMKYYINAGVPLSKLGLGIPFFGRTFTMLNRAKHDIGDSVTSAGEKGPLIEVNGVMGYNEVTNNSLKFFLLVLQHF